MTDPQSYRETVRVELELAGFAGREAEDMERRLSKAAIVACMSAGFTIAMAAEALGIPESTARTWARSDPDFCEMTDGARENTRGWLIGELINQLKLGGKAASQAANILANLHFPELRQREIKASFTGGPDPDRAAANLAALLERGD